MQIQQLSIFVENKSGRLAEITEALAAAKVSIRAVSIADTSDFGILRLIVDRPQEAVKVLKGANLMVTLTSVIAVGFADVPGAFAEVLRTLADQDIGVEYMYAFNSRDRGRACVILRVTDNEKAIEVLARRGVSIVTAEEIYGLENEG